MQIKGLTELKLSLYKCKKETWGRWKPVSKQESAITIYLSSAEAKSYDVAVYLTYTFLIEYLCACVFRGNHFKKRCADRPSLKKRRYCVPGYLASEIMNCLLDDDDFE